MPQSSSFWSMNIGHLISAVVFMFSVWTFWLIGHDEIVAMKKDVQAHEAAIQKLMAAVEKISETQRGISENQLRVAEILRDFRK